MRDFDNAYLRRASAIAARAAEIARTRLVHWVVWAVLVLLVIFPIAGAAVVPHVVRGILTKQVATALHRPVAVGRIRFNPYTLRLQIDSLQVGNDADANRLAAFAHFDARASWASAFRLAPIITEVTLVKPSVNLVRNADGVFNFENILAPKAPAAAPSPAPAPTAKFSVANIRIIDGAVTFDDQKVSEHHAIENLQLNIPFISNLPSKVGVVVEPLLQMVVDGRPVRIAAASKPFGGSLDSAAVLRFHRIDLSRYVGYLPNSIAIKLPSGALSADLLLHFIQRDNGPNITLNGAVAVDQFDLRDSSNAPVLAIDHGEVKLADVEPLGHAIFLRQIALVGLKANLVRNHDGATNVAMLLGSPPPAKPSPAPAPQTVPAPAPPPQEESPSFDAGVDSIKVTGSAVSVTDLTGTAPAAAALDAINVSVDNLYLHGQVPADFNVNANLHSGGTIAIKGTVDLPKSDLGADVAVDQVDLPALRAFAQSVLAGTVASGKFAAHATLKTHFTADKFNVHAEPADASIDNLTIEAPRSKEPPIAWTHFGVKVGSFDLAQHQVDVKEVRSDAIKVSARRDRRGDLSLMDLLQKPPPPTPEERAEERAKREKERKHRTAPASTASSEPPWQYQIESVAIEKTELRFRDRPTTRPVFAEFAPLNVHVKDFSSDFAKPFSLEVDGVRNRRGTFKIEGTAAIRPLKADLRVATKGVEMAEIDDYARTNLNAEITSAALTMNGNVAVAQSGKDYGVKYSGGVTLGDVQTIDKVTGDDFLKWRSLSISGIDLAAGDGPPKVQVEGIALSDFYARVILNSNGKLNLNDITASPNEQPKSLTRAEEQPSAPATPTPAAVPTPAPRPLNADIQIGEVTLQGGHVDYTDDFIKPHYSANLTDIAGSIGAFGTATTQPADVQLKGQVNGSSPLNISGSVNPLTPMAFVDLRAKADAIELTGLSPYSTKYTGYPIIKGTLTADVHYLLKGGELAANNHLFIDQFTFGDRVENSTATNLPVRFAVAVLKNSRGEIDLNIPVSGSLSDPQFSIGGVIWQAFFNVIMKAITSPFSLLTSAVGGLAGGGGGNRDLSYVPFDPGLATLTPDAKTGLTTVANALADHPALTITICGRVDPKLDLPGLREAWVAEQVRAQKIRDLGGEADPESVQVTPAEYNKYLEKAYFKAKFPKPRNYIGLAKTLPPDEMKKLMLTNAPVNDDSLSKLADARANLARRYLAATVPPSRLSVAAPKLNAEGIKDGPTTRADLSLQ